MHAQHLCLIRKLIAACPLSDGVLIPYSLTAELRRALEAMAVEAGEPCVLGVHVTIGEHGSPEAPVPLSGLIAGGDE